MNTEQPYLAQWTKTVRVSRMWQPIHHIKYPTRSPQTSQWNKAFQMYCLWQTVSDQQSIEKAQLVPHW